MTLGALSEHHGHQMRDFALLIESISPAVFATTTLVAAEVCGTPLAFLATLEQGKTRVRGTFGSINPNRLLPPLPWDPAAADGPFVANDPAEYKGLSVVLSQLGLDTVRFYASVPLVSSSGYPLGILAVLDPLPRKLAPRRLEILSMLATQFVTQIVWGQQLSLQGTLHSLETAIPHSDEPSRQLKGLETLLTTQRTIDEMTGVRNERVFRDRLIEEFERFERMHQAFALVIIEIDRIEEYRSQFGAEACLRLLRHVAHMLLVRTRYCDTVACYGDDRFALILPGARPQDAADVADKFTRASSADLPDLHGHELRFGFAHVPGTARTSQSLIEECLHSLRRNLPVL